LDLIPTTTFWPGNPESSKGSKDTRLANEKWKTVKIDGFEKREKPGNVRNLPSSTAGINHF